MSKRKGKKEVAEVLAGQEETLASLVPDEVIAAAAKRRRSDAAGHKTFASASDKVERRTRKGDRELLRDVLIGYVEELDDPQQQGQVKESQSAQITALEKSHGKDAVEHVPIGKQHRHLYVWMASSVTHGKNFCKRYTCNENHMAAVKTFPVAEDNTCDICGACCTEELYEFRCVRRMMRGEDTSQRRLHPFKSFISKKCGRGLLGVQSETSKLVEQLTTIVAGDNAVKELQDIWASASPAHRRLIEDKLRYLARTELGESERLTELRKAETLYGALVPQSLDVFRACSRSLQTQAPVTAWDLAATAVYRLSEQSALPTSGYLADVAQCMVDQQPLPQAPVPWFQDDVVAALASIVRVLPLKVTLHFMIQEDQVFEPANGDAEVDLELVYVEGSSELHALARQLIKGDASGVKSLLAADLAKARQQYKSSQQLSRNAGPKKSLDANVEIPEGTIENEHVCKTLNAHKWPLCFSRPNVTPDGATYISAFPIGVVLNYCKGLMCSRTMRAWPRLTQVITRWFGQWLKEHDPEFRYTTMQLNRNYGAKMHVDMNNHGWSYIIGLGDYEGGDLWLYDPKQGTEAMEVKEPMRGFPELKVGSKIKGVRQSIKNQFVKFDGNLPHSVYAFNGTRMSVVFFTRKKFVTMTEECKREAIELGFNIPGPDYIAYGTDTERSALASAASAATDQPEEKPEDQPDEEEQLDARLRTEEEGGDPEWRASDWPAVFQKYLEVNWGNQAIGDKPLGIVTCCTGPGAALALQDLVPPGCMRLLGAAETNASAVKMMRQKQNFKDLVLFAEPQKIVDGDLGYDEVSHEKKGMPSTETDLFVSTFQLEPFLNRDTEQRKASCVDDPRSQSFRQSWRFLEKKKPPVALLFISDWDEMQPKQRMLALSFVLDGVDKKDGAKWGLRHIPDYGLELCQLKLQDFGTPLASACALLVLVHNNSGGAAQAQAIASLVRSMAGQLPHVSLQELLLHRSSTYISEVTKKEWVPNKPKGKKDGMSNKVLVKRMVAERRELNLKDGMEPYNEFLFNDSDLGPTFFGKDWFPHGTVYQKANLNIVWERARRGGMDMQSLVVDLSKDLKLRAWRDDGLLAGAGPHYAFAGHRPLTGREVLQCNGFPVDRLSCRGLKDSELLQIPLSGVPVPLYGAALAAALACGSKSREKMRPPADRLAALLAAAKASLKTGELCAAQLALPDAQSLSSEDNERAQFEGRAAALLNILHHAEFGKDKRPISAAGEKAKRVLQTLDSVAKEDPGVDIEYEQMPAVSATTIASRSAEDHDDPRDWAIRLRKIRFANPKPAADKVLRWVRDACDECDASFAFDIVGDGLDMLDKLWNQKLAQNDSTGLAEVLEEIREAKDEMRDLIQTAGTRYIRRTQAFFDRLDEKFTHDAFLSRDPSKAVEHAEEHYGSISSYIDHLRRALKTWPMKRAFLEHLQRGLKPWAEACHRFAVDDGVAFVQEVLQDPGPPGGFDKEWGQAKAEKALWALAEKWPQLLPVVYSVCPRMSDQTLAARFVPRVRDRMLNVACEAVEGSSTVTYEQFKTFEFSNGDSDVCQRIRYTEELIALVIPYTKQDTAGKTSDELVRFLNSMTNGLRTLRQPQTLKDPQWEARLSAAEREFYQKTWQDIERVKNDVLKEEQDAKLKKQQQDEVERLKVQRLAREEANEQRVQQARQAMQEVEGVIDMNRSRLFDESDTGVKTLMPLTEALLDAKKGLPAHERQLSTDIDKLMKVASAAARHHNQRNARLAMAKRRLIEARLGNILPLLEQGHVLGRLPELKQDGQVLLEGLGLPPESFRRLMMAAHQNAFDERRLAPTLKRGWEMKVASSCGLEYAYNPSSGESVFRWPDDEPILATPEEPPPPPGFTGVRAEEDAPYIIPVPGGEAHCLLCGGVAADRDHLGGKGHAQAARLWRKLADDLTSFASGLKQDSSSMNIPVPGLREAWRGELLEYLQAWCKKQGQWGVQVVAVAWHVGLKDNLEDNPDVYRGGWAREDVHFALETAVAAMRLPEKNAPPASQPQPEPAQQPSPAQSLREEPPLPQPCEDFPIYSETDSGFEVKGGKLWCAFCYMEVKNSEEDHVVTRRHIDYKSAGVLASSNLCENGHLLWRQGIIIAKQKYECTLCKKAGDWWEMNTHTESNTHKKSLRNSDLAEVGEMPWELERKIRWEASVEAAAAAAKQKALEKPAAPPQPAQPAAAAVQSAPPRAASKPAKPVSPPKPAPVLQEPPLPCPGQDFPIHREGDTGLGPKGGKLWCCFCYMEVKNSEEDHVVTRRHKDYKSAGVEASSNLCKNGHLLWRQGIVIHNEKYECTLCKKANDWWEVFTHLDSNSHKKAVQYSEFAELGVQAFESDRKARWDAALADALAAAATPAVPVALAAAATPAASSGPRPPGPVFANPKPTRAPAAAAPAVPRKKARTSEPPAAGSVAAAIAAYDASTAPRPPATAKGYELPSPDWMAAAAQAAANRYAPPLPAPLTWGYFHKTTKKLYVFCTACKSYTDVIQFNLNTGKFEDEDGSCAHWTAEVRQHYAASCREALKRQGW